jgi:hypothetical protein
MSKAGVVLLIVASCAAPAWAQQSTARQPEVAGGSTPVAAAPDAGLAPAIARLTIRPPWEQTPLEALACDGAGGTEDGLARGEDVFVVRDGYVLVRLPGTGLALPVPGGGASGCIDPDGVQRGYDADDLLRGLTLPCRPGAAARTAPN